MAPGNSEETPRKRSASDFIFGKVIGEGSFSTVYLAKDIHTNKEYGIKVLRKHQLKREKKMHIALREKTVLQILSDTSEHFVHLYCTFQDPERLYFVLTYAKNGELLPYLKKGNFGSTCTKYYAAELVLTLETLRAKGVVHRDLKPENVLLDENWHILLTDFGSAKIVAPDGTSKDEDNGAKRKNSFVGTAEFVSPELISNEETTYASDLWALGCIIYQMVCGKTPFSDGSEYLIFKRILKVDYVFTNAFGETVKDLIEKLLVLSPDKRLGASDPQSYTSIKNHPFFNGTDWDNLGPPPKITSLLTQSNISTDERIPDNLEPGLDGAKESRLQVEMLCEPVQPALPTNTVTRKVSQSHKSIVDLNPNEIEQRLESQKNDKWHSLVEENLILKQGLVDKRKGFFAKRRMLLLTLGPHLYYVDPSSMVLKGEIPWGSELRTEAKNFKTFFVHTPNRTYYFDDPEGYGLEWCKAIDEVRSFYYPQS